MDAFRGQLPVHEEQTRLRIGRIPYANLFPIYSMLEKIGEPHPYEFITGVPSAVNRLLREGLIDVSPSSSIEYLRRRDEYVLIDNHSISSFGPIGSILLFSKRPIETLGGLTILTTSQSETSIALLGIILSKFYDLSCPLKPADEPLAGGLASSSAYLLIGDDALREALKWPRLYIYDLGDIWYRHTGLPFVFALWIARKSCPADSPLLFAQLDRDLDAAQDRALR